MDLVVGLFFYKIEIDKRYWKIHRKSMRIDKAYNLGEVDTLHPVDL